MFHENGGDETYPVPESITNIKEIKDYIDRFSKNSYRIFALKSSNGGFSKKSVFSIYELNGGDREEIEKEVIELLEAVEGYEGIKDSKWNVDYLMGMDIERCVLNLEFEEPLDDGTEKVEIRYSRA